MLSAGLLLAAAALLLLALAQPAVERLPLTPALVYLAIGAAAAAVFGTPRVDALIEYAPALRVALELALLVSLFVIGIRLRIEPTLRAWRIALLLAGPGMVVFIAAGALAGRLAFDWSWGLAVLVAAILAPTDPVLASDVQVDSAKDRDAVRLSLTAEGAMNDGTALPAVILGLWLLDASSSALGEPRAWARELLWPVAGGAAIGLALGWGLGCVIRARVRAGDSLARDELLLVGSVTLAYGVALATHTSAFVLAFALAITMLQPLRNDETSPSERPIAERMQAFGLRLERLVEAFAVIAIGIGLGLIVPSWPLVAFAVAVLLVVRPLSVFAVVWQPALRRRPAHESDQPSGIRSGPRRDVGAASVEAPVTGHQRRLLAWFGIRGIGSLYYAALALELGARGGTAAPMLSAVLSVLAASIVLHGVSVTPVMRRYRERVRR
jgi:NhaP-type Na+/H+ or K+/H+ antiporter